MIAMDTSLNAHTLGQLLDHSFRMTVKNFIPFILPVALYSLVTTLLMDYMFTSNGDFFNALPLYGSDMTGDILASFRVGPYALTIGAMILINPLFQFVVTDLAVKTFFIREREWNILDSLRRGTGRYVTMLLATLLSSLLLMAGVFALIIGSLVVAVFLSLLYPVLVFEEETSARESLRRSLLLIRGEFWKIAGYWIVFMLIFFGIDTLTTPLLNFLARLIIPSDSNSSLLTTSVHFILNLPVAVFTIGLQSCFTVNMYFNQRIKREGFGLE